MRVGFPYDLLRFSPRSYDLSFILSPIDSAGLNLFTYPFNLGFLKNLIKKNLSSLSAGVICASNIEFDIIFKFLILIMLGFFLEFYTSMHMDI